MPVETPETTQLFVLAIDHRVDLCREILGSQTEQPSADERERAASFKQLVFEGLAQAIESGVAKSNAAIWVDADLGEAVLLRARAMALATAVSVGRPGTEAFRLEGGAAQVVKLARLGASYAGATRTSLTTAATPSAAPRRRPRPRPKPRLAEARQRRGWSPPSPSAAPAQAASR